MGTCKRVGAKENSKLKIIVWIYFKKLVNGYSQEEHCLIGVS